MNKRPIPQRILCVRFCVTGAVCGAYLLCHFLTPMLGLPLGGGLLVIFRRSDKEKMLNWALMGTAAMLLWVGLYSLLFLFPVSQLYGTEQTFTAEVVSCSEGYSASVDVRYRPPMGLPVTGRVYCDEASRLNVGDLIFINGQIGDPRSPTSDTPDYLRSQGVFFIAQKCRILSVKPGQHVLLRHWPYFAARRVKLQTAALIPNENGALLTALLTGDTSSLSETRLYQMNRMGIRHIVAVSGLHVGFLLGLILLIPLPYQLRRVLAVPVVVLFCIFVGGRPSVFRATVMAVYLLAAPFFRRERDPLSSLALAFLLLMGLNPFCIEDVGMQLSFLSVLGIMLFYGRIAAFLDSLLPKYKVKWLKSLRSYSISSVSLTVSALSLTLPLSAHYFGGVSVGAVLSNLLLLWAVELGFLFGVTAVALSFAAPMTAAVVAVPARMLLRYVLTMLQLLNELFFFGTITPDVAFYRLFLVGLYLLAGWCAFSPRHTRRAALFLSLIILCCPLLLPLYRGWLLGNGMSVQILNVGQGQCILCLSKDKAAAIDCGGRRAAQSLAAHMDAAGEHRLNEVVLTHLDNDHTSGLPLLLELVMVDDILIPPCSKEDMAKMKNLTADYDTTVTVLKADETISVGSAVMSCYAPVGEGTDNNSGLAVLLQNDTRSVLITGDMDMKTEEKLLSTHSIHADTLVVGHHGSASSTGEVLLNTLHPKRAVISVGKNNSYGHPDPLTMMRLQTEGCAIYRTDQNGTVTLR